MIQIKLKTRMNDKLCIDEINNNLKFTNFIDIIEKEIQEKNKNIKDENMIQNNLFNEKLNKTSFDLNLNKDNEELNSDNIYINKFLSITNFLQSYAKDISLILEIYDFLLQNFPNIFDDILNIIKNKKITMEDSDRNQDYNQVNKASFYYIIESICKLMHQKICILLSNGNNDIKGENYFKSIQYFLGHLLKLEKKFMLFSNEIFFLHIIIKLIEKIKITTQNKENIDNIIIYLGEIFFFFLDKYIKIINLYFILTKIFEN